MATGARQEPPNLRPSLLQPRHPLLIGRQGRKGAAPIPGDQPIGLFERRHRKHPLEQGNRQDFGVAELRLRMGRATLARARCVFKNSSTQQ